MANDENKKMMRCSFCGKPQDRVARLIAGPGVCICNECVEICRAVLEDEELFRTAQALLENGLNSAETARQLYIHRNTLVYRLDKLQKSTGLDLRVFEDAITFKIALMVVKYMKYMETLDY